MSNAAINSSEFLDPHVLAKLHGLELRAARIVEGYVAGLHRSPYQGFSNEFAEHREYTPGDDLRYVDWKVFGKTDKYYLKQFEAETNLICYLLLDISESMRYQGPTAPLSKLTYAQCVAASLAYLVLQQHDSVSLVTFDDEVRQLVRPSSSPRQLKQLLHVMEATSAVRKTRTGPMFHELAERLTRRGPPDLRQALAIMRQTTAALRNIGRNDLGPIAAAGIDVGDHQPGLQAPEAQGFQRMPPRIARLVGRRALRAGDQGDQGGVVVAQRRWPGVRRMQHRIVLGPRGKGGGRGHSGEERQSAIDHGSSLERVRTAFQEREAERASP